MFLNSAFDMDFWMHFSSLTVRSFYLICNSAMDRLTGKTTFIGTIRQLPGLRNPCIPWEKFSEFEIKDYDEFISRHRYHITSKLFFYWHSHYQSNSRLHLVQPLSVPLWYLLSCSWKLHQTSGHPSATSLCHLTLQNLSPCILEEIKYTVSISELVNSFFWGSLLSLSATGLQNYVIHGHLSCNTVRSFRWLLMFQMNVGKH